MTILLNNINSFLQNDVLTFLFSVIWFFSFSLILSDLLNKKQGEMYLLSFVISSFLLFIGGMINNIRISYYIGWVIIVGYLFFTIQKNNLLALIKKIEIFNSLIFILAVFILFILYEGKGFVETDEFMHWGPMVREMFKLNKFYCVPESALLVHKDYPPFFSLIELLFCLFKFEYNECYLYIGLLSFYFSIVISFCSKVKGKIDKVIIMSLFILLGFVTQKIPKEDVSLYLTIYIDYVLAVYSSYVIYNELICGNKTKQDKIIGVLFACSLLLSKQIGVVFFFLYLIVLLIENKLSLYSFLLPLLGLLIWKVIINAYGITGQFSIRNIMLRSNVLNIFVNFIRALFVKPIFIKPFKCSFVIINILIICILAFMSYKNKKNYYLVYLLGLILYSLVLVLLYGFVFSIEEAESLASFERYMYTYVLFGISYLFFIIMSQFNKRIFYILVAITFLTLSDFDNSNIFEIKEKKDVLVIKQWGDPITFKEQKENGYLLNIKIHEYIGESVNYEELNSEISNYHYLYINLYDDNFYQYWVEYTGEYDLENDSVYYVNNAKDSVTYINNNFTKMYYIIKYNLQILPQ